MTAFAIKCIALAAMLVDHTGAVFDLSIGFRVMGRIAFPLFVYLIAEGCRHTKDMKKYVLRLGLFALISEPFFDWAFNESVDFFVNTNIFYTLFLGVACVYACEKLRRTPVLQLIPVAAAVFLAQALSTDYGMIGVLFIVCMAGVNLGRLPLALDERKRKVIFALLIAVFCAWLYRPGQGLPLAMQGYPTLFLMWVFGSIPALLVLAANGKRGPGLKWLFYAAYPGHLLLLAALRLILQGELW